MAKTHMCKKNPQFSNTVNFVNKKNKIPSELILFIRVLSVSNLDSSLKIEMYFVLMHHTFTHISLSKLR